jgi:uncharacterized membrane protein YgcG
MWYMVRRSTAVWLLSGLTVLTSPAWAQSTPAIQNGQVEIFGALPRTMSGEVNVDALRQTIQTQFARPGVQEVQFRNLSLTETELRALFLNSDPDKNLLRQVSVAVPSPNGAERNVTFRGHDFRARIGREEGQLRAKIEGIDQSQLTETERQSLRAQFDRLRLEGTNDRGGNQVNNREGRGGGDHNGRGSGNSGHGSDNSGPGSANSGSGRDGDHSGRGGRDDVRNVTDDRREDRREDRQLDRRENRREDRQADRREDRRSNEGGETRSLDRADQVAGGHGREGRDHARMVQMDRPNRPERMDRPDRLDRPEESDRSGHN